MASLSPPRTASRSRAYRLANVSRPLCASSSERYSAKPSLPRALRSRTESGSKKSCSTKSGAFQRGRLLTVVSPKGNVSGCGCASNYTTTYTYNALAEPLTIKNPDGNTTTYCLSGSGTSCVGAGVGLLATGGGAAVAFGVATDTAASGATAIGLTFGGIGLFGDIAGAAKGATLGYLCSYGQGELYGQK